MGSSLSSEAAWARRWFLGIGTSFFVGGACLDPKEDHIPGQAGFAVLVFLSGHPPSGGPAIALPMVEVETSSPNSSSKASRCSSRVRSSLASRWLGSHSLSIVPFPEGLPGIALGSTSPVSLLLFSQRFMAGIHTEKVFATSSLSLPASTAASTLNLRSFEYGFIPGG